MNDTATKLGFLDKCKIMLHTTLMLLHLHDQVKGDDRFVLVTNLAPRVGVHVHLGMEKAQ
jgi:hypothetical protein